MENLPEPTYEKAAQLTREIEHLKEVIRLQSEMIDLLKRK